MDRRTPVQRLTLIMVATALVFAALLIALKSAGPHSGVHELLFVLSMVAACAVLGFAVARQRTHR